MIELYNADCLEKIKDIEDDSIDLVLIDPPYNIGKDKWDKWKTVDEYVDFMGKVFLEIQRVLKDNGSFYFFHNDFSQMAELQHWIRKNTSFIFKNLITIKKTNNSYIKALYRNTVDFRQYLNFSEYCLFYTFQKDSGLDEVLNKNDFTNLMKYFKEERTKIGWNYTQCEKLLGAKRCYCYWDKKTSHPYRIPTKEQYELLQTTGYWQKPYEEILEEYEGLREEYEKQKYTFKGVDGVEDVWEYSFREDKKSGHPTQKPIKLMEDIIRYSSNKGDLVLDCFMGSGSTGVACKHLNRNFIGIEKEEKYFKIAEERVNNE